MPLTKVSSGTFLQHIIDNCIDHYRKFEEVYQLPSYTKLSDSVAPAVVCQIKSDVKKRIQSENVKGFALVVDGSEVNHNSLINFCLVSANESIFFKTIEVNDERKTELFLTDQFSKIIEEVGENQVNIVISDGASNYLNAAMNQKNKFKHVRGIRCAIHALNSFLKDICCQESCHNLPSIVTLLQKATTVSQFVLDKPFIRKLMKKLGSPKKLKRIAMTRFYTHFLVMERLLELYTQINNTLTHAEYTQWINHSQQRHLRSKSSEVKQIVADDEYWMHVKEFIDFLRPIINLMLKLDSLTPIMGKLCRYLEIERQRQEIINLSFISEGEKILLRQRFEFRTYQIVSDFHQAAFCLDPEYRPIITKRNYLEHRNALYKLFEDLYGLDKKPELMHQWSMYISGMEEFEHKEVFLTASKMAAHDWWIAYGGQTELAKLAVRLLSMVSSNSEAERNWSDFKVICTKERGRMSSQRANDCVLVKHHVRGGRAPSRKFFDWQPAEEVVYVFEDDDLEVSDEDLEENEEDVVQVEEVNPDGEVVQVDP
ncbi:hypothetical protein GEMRC1_001228 [Eukaryota sp. GEM-RC1]